MEWIPNICTGRDPEWHRHPESLFCTSLPRAGDQLPDPGRVTSLLSFILYHSVCILKQHGFVFPHFEEYVKAVALYVFWSLTSTSLLHLGCWSFCGQSRPGHLHCYKVFGCVAAARSVRSTGDSGLRQLRAELLWVPVCMCMCSLRLHTCDWNCCITEHACPQLSKTGHSVSKEILLIYTPTSSVWQFLLFHVFIHLVSMDYFFFFAIRWTSKDILLWIYFPFSNF